MENECGGRESDKVDEERDVLFTRSKLKSRLRVVYVMSFPHVCVCNGKNGPLDKYRKESFLSHLDFFFLLVISSSSLSMLYHGTLWYFFPFRCLHLCACHSVWVTFVCSHSFFPTPSYSLTWYMLSFERRSPETTGNIGKMNIFYPPLLRCISSWFESFFFPSTFWFKPTLRQHDVTAWHLSFLSFSSFLSDRGRGCLW